MEKVVIHEPKITQMVGEKTIAKREAQLIDLEKQVKILRRHSHILKKELRSKEKPTVIVKKDISKDLLQKDQIIQHLRRTITKKEGEKQILQRKAQLLEHFLMRAKDHYVLKKLENFGMEEFTKKKFLSIQRDDILLVDDPNTMSMAVIDELRKIVSVIIHKKPVSERVRSMLPFIFIDAAKLQIKEAGSLAIVPKRQMDEHRSARSALKKVIEEYHKERNLLNSP
jgi:hypothetical protein